MTETAMLETTKNAARAEPKTRTPGVRKFRDRYPSRPYVSQTTALNSVSARKVHDRVYERVDSALYGIGMVLRIAGNEDDAATVEEVVDNEIVSASQELLLEHTRLRTLADEHGVTLTIRYTKPATIETKISSPRTVRFLSLVRDLDALIATIDGLWLAGVLDDKQHSQAIYLWQRRLFRVASRLIALAGRAFKAARNRGITDNGEITEPENGADAGLLDTAMDSEVLDIQGLPADAMMDTAESVHTEAENSAEGAADGVEAKPAKTRRRKAEPDAASA